MTYLRFGIRDLLWAMAVMGLVIGWWSDRRQLTETVGDATYNFAWASNHLTQLGWELHYKSGRVSDIRREPPASR